MDIQAFIFDAYGTLFDVYAVDAECAQIFGDRAPEVVRLWRAKQLEYTWLRSLMNRFRDFYQVTEDALIYACRKLDIKLSGTDKDRLMQSYLQLAAHPEARSALEALNGRPRAILSNGTPDMLARAAQAAGLSKHLEHIFSVSEIEIYKPDPRVYQLACDRLELTPAQAVFVSSNSFDVCGAKHFGFFTCWINRSGQPLDELDVEPDATLSSLTELAERFG